MDYIAAPVRLAHGRHRSAAQGICVMELAALMAGEPFTDHPRCVDPVVAAFMRGFNDRLSDHSRQRLEPYAELAVGTNEGAEATRIRRDRLLAYAGGTDHPPERVRLRLLKEVGIRAAFSLDRGAAEWALRTVGARGYEPAGFPLLEELVCRVLPPAPSTQAPRAESSLPAGTASEAEREALAYA